MTRLNYTVSGKVDAPWVTLAHSLATDIRMWDAQVSALESHYRVLCFDARGHGKSPLGEASFSMTELVNDVIALWDSLGIAHSHFVGLSMGGMTGIGLVLQHPHRVDSLAACDCRLDAPDFFLDTWDQRIAAVEEGGMAAIVDGIIDTWLCDKTGATQSRQEALARKLILDTPAASYTACAKAIKTLDYKNSLRRISVPVLYLVGENDGPHPAEMKQFDALTATSTFVCISDAAHLSNLDQPEAFNKAIVTFLSAQKASGARPRPVDVEQWPQELAAIAADMNDRPINVHKLMANNPTLLNAWWNFRNHSVKGGTLGPRKLELLILRVGVHMSCWYEWASHVDRALKVGINIDEIRRVLQPDTREHWSAADATLLRAVDELTGGHAIQAETLATLEQCHSNAQIMDLIAIHGMYLILAGMIKTWGLDLDTDVLGRIAAYTDEASFLAAAQRFGRELA